MPHVTLIDKVIMPKSEKRKIVRGCFHNHGPWTCFAKGKFSLERFPRSIEAVANLAISCGWDFLAITDPVSDKVHPIYQPLLATANPNQRRYDVQEDKEINYITHYFRIDGKKLDIIRTYEIVGHHHALAVGLEQAVLGCRPIETIVREIKARGGYVVSDHSLSTLPHGRGMGEENIRRLNEQGLIDALEWNANLMGPFKGFNIGVLKLGEELDIPVIAEPDAHRKQDFKAHTIYEVSSNYSNIVHAAFNAVKENRFQRVEIENSFISLPIHFLLIKYNHFRDKMGWIDSSFAIG